MKKTKHMTGVDIKYWFAYCISILNSQVTHTLTEAI